MRISLIAQKIFLYIYTFLFIFNPSIFSKINLVFLLSPLAIFFLLLAPLTYKKYLSNRRVFLFIVVNTLFFIFLFSYYLTGALDSLPRAYSFIFLILNSICAMTVYFLYQRIYDKKISSVMNFILRIAGIQIVFVILTLWLPGFREWVLLSAREESIYNIANDLGAGLRSYGLASGYTSSFPMFMGICSLISIYFFNISRSIISKIKYLILTMLLLLSVILNARIGLFPIVIWTVLSPLYYLYRRNIKLLFLILIFVLIIPYFLMKYNVLNSELFFRINQGIEEIVQLINGNITGTFETLYDMWFFPKNALDLLFGQGINIVGANTNSSDIGFIQDVYMYGLIPTFLLIIFLIYFFKPLSMLMRKRFGIIFNIVFFLSLIAYYMKGMTFYSNEVVNTLIFLAVFAIFTYKKTLTIISRSYSSSIGL